MLDADEGSEVPSASTNIHLTPQYFDGQKRVGLALGRAAGSTQPLWDAYLFYPPDATWPDVGAPIPELAIAQLGGVVVGTPGTLPAKPDQSALLPELSGKAAVIGEQENFDVILRQVAEPFVAHHRK